MPEKTYDDLVLEVATELDQTSLEDFVAMLQRAVERRVNRPAEPKAAPKHFTFDVIDDEFAEVTLTLPVKMVLAGRDIDPSDVVAVFHNNAGPSKRISIIEINVESRVLRCFSLVQRHVNDEDFRGRYQKLRKTVEALPPSDE